MNRTTLKSFVRVLAIGSALASFGVSESVTAQSAQKISIGLSGSQFGNGKAVKKDSAPWLIFPATEYHYSIKGKWVGKGALAAAIPNVSNIATFLEQVEPGSSELLIGKTGPIPATFPATVLNRKISGTRTIAGVGKVKISMVVAIKILETGVVQFSISKVNVKDQRGKRIPGTVRFAGTKVLVTTFPQ
jgi:hypothetical protein